MLVWWCISSSALSQGGENEVVERDAEPLFSEREATAAAATDNTSHSAAEHVITYPSRLIYYLKEDSESTYHDLDTRARNQGTEGHDQVRQHTRLICIWPSYYSLRVAVRLYLSMEVHLSTLAHWIK